MVRKNYPLLDVLKFCLAILVIALHCDPFVSYNSYLQTGFRNIISTIAIPIFFVVSSFLFYEKINLYRSEGDTEGEKNYFKKYCFRILGIYLFWSIIYLPFVIVEWCKLDNFSFVNILEYVRSFIFSGSYSTLWFLPALLTGIVLTYFLTKKVKNKFVLILIPSLFYLLCAACTTYYGLFARNSSVKTIIDACDYLLDGFKNGLFFAFLPVMLGYLLNKNKAHKTSVKKHVLLLVLFFALFGIEAFACTFLGFSTNGVDQWIFLMPFSYVFVSAVISIQYVPTENTVLLRKMSILMFLTQRIPLTLFSYMGNNVFNNSFTYFLLVLATTMLISYLFIKLSDKVKVLKRFY